MNQPPRRSIGLLLTSLLIVAVGCGSSGSAPPSTGSGSPSGSLAGSGSAGTGTLGPSGSNPDAGTLDAMTPIEAGADVALPPSCASGGPGLSNCGQSKESCCTSLLVTGGTCNRTYDSSDAGAAPDGASTAGSDPATVSTFRLDKYDVTVGRFRQFVNVALLPDGGAGWLPAAGSGKHTHLNGGLGLVDVGRSDAGMVYEPGWSASDDSEISPTTSNLLSCPPTSTWTSSAGAQENLPANCMNWWEAFAFCIWDGGFLPSDAEWEYAAAGGSQQRAYPWGSMDPGSANQYAIYNCNYPNGSGNCTDISNIAPVGTAILGAGRWGQLDLAGNVWQWTADFYAAYVNPCTDCAFSTGGSSRGLRGGGFREPPSNLSPTYRNANNPSIRNDFIGIRCARIAQ